MKDNYPSLPTRFPTIYPAATGAAVPTPVSPNGLDASRVASSGARLALGAKVEGGPPGLYESAQDPLRSPLAGTDRVVDPNNPDAAPPAPSRFTLVQQAPAAAPARTAGGFILPPAGPGMPALAAAGPQPSAAAPANPANPNADLNRNATALALERIMTNPGAGATAGATPAGPISTTAADSTLAPLGNAGRLMTAAAGMEGDRLNFAANDIVKRMGPQAPQASDTPEVRASKFAYFSKVMSDQVAQDPTLGGASGQPTTQDLATKFNALMQQGNQPRVISVGKDATGKDIQRIYNPRTGNDSALPKAEKSRKGEPAYSTDGKFYRSSEDDEWKPVPAAHEKALTVTEWMMAGRPGENYKSYRDEYDKASKAVAPKAPAAPTPAAAAPGATPATKQQPAAVYRHEDVQAELKRRGLVK